ncbi:MAG: DUF2802 domain-containing protein [Rhodocyclaceae bacterium]|nr:DUF2802 domain-containing protein [Rhodocyclaceae bacterium]
MDIGEFARDVLLVVAGLVGIYLVVMVLRLTQLRRRKAIAAAAEAPAAPAADDEAEEEPFVYEAPVVPRPAAAPADFGAELARSHQDAELRQLRDELAQLREEVGQLRADLADLNAARLVSPQYSDAMALAQRGLTAQDVADRCGISLGEAELVWALSRGPMNFDQEEDYGGESGVKHARSA